MLKQLRIKNFKGWKDTGPIKTAPITLFFGANSSGKSSIGQFLMMLKQTAESSDRRAVLYPGSKTTCVNLGSYMEMVYQRDPKNCISFDYSWLLAKALTFEDPTKKKRKAYSFDAVSFMADIGLPDQQGSSPVVNHFVYTLHNPDKGDLQVGMCRTNGDKVEYNVEAEGYKLVRQAGRPWSPRMPNRFYGFPDEVVAYHQNADFVQLINLEHERLFGAICYLGPLRNKAERLYSWTGLEPDNVGYAGENSIAALLAARSRSISLGYKQHAKPFYEIIAQSLKKIGLIDEFKVSPISAQRQEYEVKVRVKGARDWVDLPDVGFGVSQVLPVLIQCFYAPPGSIILMEQPEIHLHPRAQSALADVMIDAVNAREDGHDRNIQLIIETHSEHFLRRLQRRIAEDVLPKEKMAAYFANTTRTPATLEPLQIDVFGNIQNWPENFFGDEMEDITQQAKAAMNKRIKQANAGDSA